jgi:hypothetical protein
MLDIQSMTVELSHKCILLVINLGDGIGHSTLLHWMATCALDICGPHKCFLHFLAKHLNSWILWKEIKSVYTFGHAWTSKILRKVCHLLYFIILERLVYAFMRRLFSILSRRRKKRKWIRNKNEWQELQKCLSVLN